MGVKEASVRGRSQIVIEKSYFSSTKILWLLKDLPSVDPEDVVIQ